MPLLLFNLSLLLNFIGHRENREGTESRREFFWLLRVFSVALRGQTIIELKNCSKAKEHFHNAAIELPNVQVSDTREDDSSNTADFQYQIIFLKQAVLLSNGNMSLHKNTRF